LDSALNNIFLIWGEKELTKFVLNLSTNDLPCTVLNLCEKPIFRIDNIESDKIIFIDGKKIIYNDPLKFIMDYRDLIGTLSINLNSQYWLATNMASKNRFNSKLPLLLQQIEACSIVIGQNLNNLVIYRPDLAIISSLRAMIGRDEFNLIYSRWYVKKRLLIEKCHALATHLKSFIGLFYRLILIRLFFNNKFGVDLDLSKKTYALKTFFYPSTIDDNNDYAYHDPMFGRLPQFLSKSGNMIIITHIINNYKNCIEKINRHKHFTIIPIEYWLSTYRIVKSFFEMIFFPLRKKVPEFVSYRGMNVSGIIKLELYRKCNDISLQQYVFFGMMEAFFKTQHIDQYIYTYENNPWEKMSISAIRKISPLTKIVGFQHAVVPQSSVNVFSSDEEYNSMLFPDKIICVGQETIDIINQHSSQSIKALTIGCGLRYEYLQTLFRKSRNHIQKILVVPEGVSGVVPMLNYVIRELMNKQEYQITLRFHPSLTYEALKAELDYDLNKIDNIFLSKSSLQDDLKEHDLCIYWGSTVALEALSMGTPLIHYNMQTLLSYDPLFCCKYLKWTVTETDSLSNTIETINSMGQKEFSFQMEQALNYIRSYFYPVTEKNMQVFLCETDQQELN
jgi:hypothetical protein